MTGMPAAFSPSASDFSHDKPAHYEACLHQMQQQPFSFPVLSFEKEDRHLK